ncbi:hypothetical protein J1N10_08510 [Carboxylicivirga sp. A043]|uniref:hypothetical protein n=1 Tax=Carboxylicivirga litoralis TaxID=2816963 RepID=UPI0021CB1E5B|nr:hypothetical protein [Carboxylicivirga sp. A043]MCU4156017.1 hypothetical protein [Carboxylicivirga sp. A043]
MFQRLLFIFLYAFSLLACTDLDTNKISEEIEFKPNLSLPLGKLEARYDEVTDLPFDLPDPIGSTPVSWTESDTVFFNIESSVAERKYIVSLMLQFDITNHYPAEIEVDLYFIDIYGRDVPLTPTPLSIKAAEIDENGRVIQEMHTDPYPYKLPLSDEQIDGLLFSEKIVIKGAVNELLLTQQVVNNFDNYSLLAAIGVQAQIDYSINNF